MPKYEIMLLLDPKSDGKEVKALATSVFKKVESFETMDNKDIAYEINNSKTGTYILLNVETEGEDIKEFTRKINIDKTVWRYIVVNKEEEEKLLAATKPARPRPQRGPRNNQNRGPRRPRPEGDRRPAARKPEGKNE